MDWFKAKGAPEPETMDFPTKYRGFTNPLTCCLLSPLKRPKFHETFEAMIFGFPFFPRSATAFGTSAGLRTGGKAWGCAKKYRGPQNSMVYQFIIMFPNKIANYKWWTMVVHLNSRHSHIRSQYNDIYIFPQKIHLFYIDRFLLIDTAWYGHVFFVPSASFRISRSPGYE